VTEKARAVILMGDCRDAEAVREKGVVGRC
jgi:hypothetical protein